MPTSMSSRSAIPDAKTADELWLLPDNGHGYELVRGELRRSMPAGFRHGVVAGRVTRSVMQAVMNRDLGVVCAAETGFRLADDHVRAPDAAFVGKTRIEGAELPETYWPGAPDLAVEVLSPSDRYTDVEEKVFDWIDAGTRMVVVVNDRRRTTTVFRSRTEVAVLGEGDTLDGDPVVPGWSLPLAEIFG